MLRENKRFIPDIRVSIFLSMIGSLVILLYKNEITFIVAFVISLAFIVVQGQYKKAFKFIAAFLIFLLLSTLMVGKSEFTTLWVFITIARHLLIPLIFLQGISEKSTGELLAVCCKLHFPKSFGVSAIVLIRFLPTIKYEISSIRGTLKFRGIGVSIFSTLIHLPQNFYLTLIPLLIRTLRISDEITAAALTRGVEVDNDIVSFSEVKWKNLDSMTLIAFIGIFVVLGVIEMNWGWIF